MKPLTLVSSLAATAVLGTALAVPASASPITWDFFALAGGSNHALGAQYSFTNPEATGQYITAYALVPPNPWYESNCSGSSGTTTGAPCLYVKGAGTLPGNPERGLGLIPNAQNEIFYPDGIGILASAPILSLSIGSVQSGESWQVQGCYFNSLCTTLDQGIGGGTNSIVNVSDLGNYADYVVDVPCANGSSCMSGTTTYDNNIVLMSVTTSVPEPATFALFAVGLAGLGFMVRRRKTTG
ncbi:MAG: PEP-CTERM sorting domain-containing protein [Proteobacteria bacterium]|nr:PEP-CTERM sorting domain-containing protein [Pseudomonadota bacterium]